MSRQEKTVSERHTRTLRELVKRPENKVCADCKRNDPRWASWNIGVFLCIRCSGIHRSMGTHISKVKSVDLDIWTPEQMTSIQLWGNSRANLYWEAHLKPGHIPPEHKMESFIRSKYESRRWALEGPPPKDPSVLEDAREHHSELAPPPTPQPQSPPRQALSPTQRRTPTLVSNQAMQAQIRPAITPPALASAPVLPPLAPTPADDLFSLDFHAPTNAAGTIVAQGGKKDVKNDILSLFASPSSSSGILGSNSGSATQQQFPPSPQSTSMMGSSGTGLWGVQSGWNSTQAAQPTQINVWGQPQQPQQQQPLGTFGGVSQTQNSNLLASQNIWGTNAPTGTQTGPVLFSTPFSSGTGTVPQPKKDDAFGDLWGGFK